MAYGPGDGLVERRVRVACWWTGGPTRTVRTDDPSGSKKVQTEHSGLCDCMFVQLRVVGSLFSLRFHSTGWGASIDARDTRCHAHRWFSGRSAAGDAFGPRLGGAEQQVREQGARPQPRPSGLDRDRTPGPLRVVGVAGQQVAAGGRGIVLGCQGTLESGAEGHEVVVA